MKQAASRTLLLILLGCTSWLTAQADLLDDINRRAASVSALQGEFIQTKHIAHFPAPIRATGIFNYQRNDGMLWTTQTPLASVLKIDADGIHNLAAGAAENRSSPSRLISRIFLDSVTGKLATTEKYFSIASSGDRERWELRLRPLSTSIGSSIGSYIVEIRLRGGEHTEQIIISETNGDSTTIDLTVLNAQYFAD